MKKKTLEPKGYRKDDFWSTLSRSIDEIDLPTLNKIIDLIWTTHLNSKTIFFAGNGGSASTASHFAADLGKNTTRNHFDQLENRMKTMSLCDNVAWITAVSNDMSYDDIFVEQLKSFATPGDLIVIISGSGNSTNLIKTALWVKDHGLHSIGILGFDGGYIKDFLELSIIVNNTNYGIIESVHGSIQHYIVEVLKKRKKLEKK